jgi:hypothetical protein
MKIFTISVIVFVTVVVGVGFYMAGSPQSVRRVEIDNMMVNRLSNAEYELSDLYRRDFSLPEIYPSAEGVEYMKIGTSTYSLCADFMTSSGVDEMNMMRNVPRPYMVGEVYVNGGGDWTHGEGRNCFERSLSTTSIKL